ncbi:hypothetical protein [uncultured Helicobacter sp.]|uniref:hypothetical protein n=1 Tax=uncultured Helicobacter sp. TaxID=175537 RepID=UPI00374E9048
MLKKIIFVCGVLAHISLGYDSFRVGWSGADLSELKGSYGSKSISGIIFGIERGGLWDNVMVAWYLDGNVWPLNAMNDGGYYSIGIGGKIGYRFTHLLPYVRIGAEYMSLYHTGTNDTQRNIGGAVAEIGTSVDIADGFGLGIALKSSVPNFYGSAGDYRLFNVMVYFVYYGF